MFVKLTKEEFIEKANAVHIEEKFDYSLVEYQDTHTKIKIICPVGHVFEQTTAATESQATVALNLTKGLEDCKLYWFKPSENSRSISIVRCPNSTVSTNQEVTEGKATHVQTTVTIDGVEYAPIKK